MDGEVWHLVEARRDDGAPTIFRIRELDPRLELSRIFVVEMPYPITEMSRLPNATGYRRLAQFEEQWVTPGLRGHRLHPGRPQDRGRLVLPLSLRRQRAHRARRAASPRSTPPSASTTTPNPTWDEYATLRDLLEEAKAMLPAAAERAATEPAKAAAKPPRTKRRRPHRAS